MSLIFSKVKEHFGYYVDANAQEQEQQSMSISVMDILIFLISCYAAYLSWSCNSAKGVQFLSKVVYAFFAFLFGVMYVVFYGVFKEKLTPCKF